MGKIVFTNKIFHYLLIGYLVYLIFRNSLNLFSGVMFSLVPIIIQVLVLGLIITGNRYAKVAVQFWSILLMVGPGLIVLGKSLVALVGEDVEIEIFLINIFNFAIGFSVFFFSNKYIEVLKESEEIDVR